MNRVRIIGGRLGSRVIRFSAPAASGFRPTPDRVRETLFNWLGQDLSGAVCLDLFAGSGALGFEAASRGARRVVMVEHDARLVADLAANNRLFGLSGVEIVRRDALEFARSASRGRERFDIIFLDPPFHCGWIDRLVPDVVPLLNDEGFLYIEAEHEVTKIDSLLCTRHGKAGQVHYHLLQQQHEDPCDAR